MPPSPLLRLMSLSRTLSFRVVAASLVSAVLATVGMTWWSASVMQNQATRALLHSSAAEVEAVANLLSSRIEVMHTVLSGAVPDRGEAWMADPQAMQSHLDRQASLLSLFDWVFLGDLAGQLAVLSGARPLPDATKQAQIDVPAWSTEVSKETAAVARLVHLLKGNAPAIVLTVPVRGEHGQLLGMLGGVIALQSPQMGSFRRVIEQDMEQSGTRTLLVADDGTIVFHPDSRRVLGSAALEPNLQEAFASWVDNGRTVHAEGVASLADDGLVAMAGMPASQWMVMRWLDVDQAFQPLRRSVSVVWGAGVMVALLMGSLAGAGVWLSTRSVRRLQSQAEGLLLQPEGMMGRDWLEEDSEIGRLARAFREVVEQREQRGAETRHLLDQLRAMLDLAPVGIAFARSGRIELISEHLARLLGRSVQSLVGEPIDAIQIMSEDRAGLVESVRLSFADSGYFDGNARFMRPDGSEFHGRMRAREVVKGDFQAGTIWIIEDVTAELEAQKQLSWQAGHDPLTGLSNRLVFEQELKLAFEAPRTVEEPSFCALFLDLDRFKQVNDSAGHAAGDKLLCDLALLMVAQVRQNDMVARLGGDEFAVLLPFCPLNRALDIAEAIRREIEAYRLVWDGQTLGVGASIGVISSNGAYESTEALMRAADAACYVAKHGGRNRVVVGEPGVVRSAQAVELDEA